MTGIVSGANTPPKIAFYTSIEFTKASVVEDGYIKPYTVCSRNVILPDNHPKYLPLALHTAVSFVKSFVVNVILQHTYVFTCALFPASAIVVTPIYGGLYIFYSACEVY